MAKLASTPVLRALLSGLAVCVAIALPDTASAQGAARSWAVLYAGDTGATTDDAARIAGQLGQARDALHSHGEQVIGDMVGPFEQNHSQPPIEVSPDKLKALRDELDRATKHLALGELQDALDKMSRLENLQRGARDYLNREIAQARKLFSACVATAYLLHESGRRQESAERMQSCAATFPDFDLPATEFSSSMRQLFDETTAYQREHPVWLRVESRVADQTCNVRLNGVDVGRAPLRMRAHEGVTSIQLECKHEHDDSIKPARIHEIVLKSGDNVLIVDPTLDEAVRESSPWVYLQYASAEIDQQRIAEHALEVGRALAVDRVLVLDEHNGKHELLNLAVTSGELERTILWSGQARDLPRSIDQLLAPPGALIAAPTLEATIAAAPTAPSAHDTMTGIGHSLPWPVYAASGALWAAGLATTFVMTEKRSELEVQTFGLAKPLPPAKVLPADEFDYRRSKYKAYGWTGATLSVIGTLPVLAISMAALPERDSVPWWGWALTGVGAGLAGVGVSVISTASPKCAFSNAAKGSDEGRACSSWANDRAFGALLLVNALAPLSVGLTYLLGSAFRSDHLQLQAQAGAGSAMLELKGRL